MKRRFAFALVLLSATLLYATTTIPPTPAPPAAPPAAGAIGRYQLTVVSGTGNTEIWLLDTQTGDTWRHYTPSGVWLYMGNPTQSPGPKFPTPRTPATRPPASAPQLLPERP